MSDTRNVPLRGAFCLRELAVVIATVVLATAVVVPALGGLRGGSMVDASLSRLGQLGLAYELYVQDWAGRQPTYAVDGLTSHGGTAAQALAGYEQFMGQPHPGHLLGWGTVENGRNVGMWGFFYWGGGNAETVQAIDFNTRWGHFRTMNSKAFHDYLGGRWFEETFYAPADTVAWDAAAPYFDEVNAYIPNPITGSFIWPSYCWSPAAMMNPQVMRAPSAGGWQAPFTLSDGLDVPPAAAVLYPGLKTHVIEHHWLQARPSECNPAFPDGTYFGCEPWFFNHGIDSTPATLFYDGSIRLLPNTEVQAADQAVLIQTEGVDGLWSRDTPAGADGYFLEAAFDDIVDVSHHVFTTDGILGRDTLSGMAAAFGPPDRPRKRGPRRLGVFRPLVLELEEGWLAP